MFEISYKSEVLHSTNAFQTCLVYLSIINKTCLTPLIKVETMGLVESSSYGVSFIIKLCAGILDSLFNYKH